ncbi:toll/interleukin-1 receptor domain-containing protein [Rathayibacter sp. SD072]|uniref:toll/interleukin-1 receptor domain-containing protein n=1 Tax=Rathayibacter sp. SD072 TaxID=2781731 RepID=UPI001A96D0DD|nr:toll/interleukin-1 receptor domain-containing protein [Rathayibacter sp. SD072]MBO0985220.1 toll/interleukin-1 receptor domain-containing protein [Rathayibacter sp. SD072]
MADVAISYAHIDGAVAADVRDQLRTAGYSVWMDDPGEEAVDAVGIPIGSSHWIVIRAEFAAATQILVLDSQNWRASEYCSREYTLCLELGKPTHFVSTEDASSKAVGRVQWMAARSGAAAQSHARLAARLVDSPPASSWVQRILFSRRAHDAEAVLGAQDPSFNVTPAIREVVDADLAQAARTRGALRRIAVASFATLVVLATVSILGWIGADTFSAQADASRRTAQASELTRLSAISVDTTAAVAQAAQAVTLDPSTVSQAALRAAQMRDGRLRVIELMPSEFIGGAWASDRSVVAAYSLEYVVMIDTETGGVKSPLAVDSKISAGRFVVGPKAQSAVYVDTNGTLRLLDLDTGATTPFASPSRVMSLTVSAKGELFWGTQDGGVYSAPYPRPSNALESHLVTTLDSFARAIDVNGNRLGVVSDDGWVQTFERNGPTTSAGDAVSISSDPHPEGLGGYLATVTVCDNEVTGSFLGTSIRGVRFRWIPGNEPTVISTTLQTKPMCTPEGVLYSSAVRGDMEQFSGDTWISGPSDVTRNIGVLDPLHERAASVSPSPGRLMVVGSAATTQTRIGDVVAVLDLTDRVLVIGRDGVVRDPASDEAVSRLDAPPVLGLVAIAGCDALVASNDGGIQHVDCNGTATRVATLSKVANVRARTDGAGFIVVRSSAVEVLKSDGDLERTINLTGLENDFVVDAALSPGGERLALVTMLGNLYEESTDSDTIPLRSPTLSVPAGADTAVAYSSDGGLIVLSTDGRVTRFDDGVAVAARQLDARATGLFTTESVLYISAFTEGTTVLSATTLEPIERYPSGFFTGGTSSTDHGLELVRDGDESTVGLLVTVPPQLY